MSSPTHKDIWKSMSAIDVSEWTQSRSVGRQTLSWIPWSDCMAILQSHYPDFEYEFYPITLYPDGSAEVGCKVSIGEVSRVVFLPVMDHKFNAIVAGPDSSPSSRDINDARWRAFVKCTAILTGLGFNLFRAGEGKPAEPIVRDEVKARREKKTLATKLTQLSEVLAECELTRDPDYPYGKKVKVKDIKLGKQVLNAGGPLLRVNKAIAFLTKELNEIKES